MVGGVTRRKIAGLSMIKRGNSRKRESDRKEDKDDKARSNESAPPFGGPFLPPAEVRTVAVRSLGVGMMAPWETELCFRRSPSAKALWDTGASSSLMDQSFARHLVARGVANEFPLTKSIPITFGNGTTARLHKVLRVFTTNFGSMDFVIVPKLDPTIIIGRGDILTHYEQFMNSMQPGGFGNTGLNCSRAEVNSVITREGSGRLKISCPIFEQAKAIPYRVKRRNHGGPLRFGTGDPLLADDRERKNQRIGIVSFAKIIPRNYQA